MDDNDIARILTTGTLIHGYLWKSRYIMTIHVQSDDVLYLSGGIS